MECTPPGSNTQGYKTIEFKTKAILENRNPVLYKTNISPESNLKMVRGYIISNISQYIEEQDFTQEQTRKTGWTTRGKETITQEETVKSIYRPPDICNNGAIGNRRWYSQSFSVYGYASCAFQQSQVEEKGAQLKISNYK